METILINVDSKYRDLNQYNKSTQFNYKLDKTYKNITSIKISSFELCNNNNIEYLNYNNINDNNNFFKIHIPNILNDPDGTIIKIDNNINDINSLRTDISLKLNNLQYNNKYIYIFYLNTHSTIIFDFNSTIQPKSLQSNLILYPGWYSLYGITQIIKNYIIIKYNELNEYLKKNPSSIISIPLINYNFTINSFNLNIYDIREPTFIRIDTLPDINCGNNNLLNNINYLKIRLYTYYNDLFNSITKYYINSNNVSINNNLYNFNINKDSYNFIVIENNLNYYYYTNNINTPISSWIQITHNLSLLSNKDIPTFDIDFNITDIFTTLGYYLGFKNTKYISSIYNNNIQYIKSDYKYNLCSNNYIFFNLNNWGYINFQNKYLLSKIIFNTNNYSNDIILINNEYIFRQPINIQNLEISLLNYTGDIINLNGIDYSFTIELKQVINMEDKYIYERNNNNILR